MLGGRARELWGHKGVRWVTLGWTAFVAENIVMSHNREPIIKCVGDERYHQAYSLLSTAACASIAWGYGRHGRGQGPKLWTGGRGAAWRIAAFSFQTLGAFAWPASPRPPPHPIPKRRHKGTPFSYPRLL